jgi:hypothetical protein
MLVGVGGLVVGGEETRGEERGVDWWRVEIEGDEERRWVV